MVHGTVMTGGNGLAAPVPPEFDLLDRNFYAGNPWPAYAWLREFDPVHWDEKNEFWWLSLYEDVASVSKQPEIFSSARDHDPRSTRRTHR